MKNGTREVFFVLNGHPTAPLREYGFVATAYADRRTANHLRSDLSPDILKSLSSRIANNHSVVPVVLSDDKQRPLRAAPVPEEQYEIRGDVIDCFCSKEKLPSNSCFLCSPSRDPLYFSPGCAEMSCGCGVHRGCAYAETMRALPRKCVHGLLEFSYAPSQVHKDISLAYVAGAEYSSVIGQLTNLAQRGMHFGVDPRDLAKAFLYVYDLMGLREFVGCQRLPAVHTTEFWHSLPHNTKTKSGLSFGGFEDDPNPTRDDVWLRDSNLLAAIFKMCREEMDAGSGVYLPFPLVAYKISMKLETLIGTESLGRVLRKTRLFYLPKNLQSMVDTLLMYSELKMFHRRYPYLIGHRWPNGGAMNIAHYFGAFTEDLKFPDLSDYVFWNEDQKFCDQHMLYHWYVIVYAMNLTFWDRDDPYHEVVQETHAWTCGNSAFKYVKWTGDYDWRVIAGLNASGKFDTGHMNTIVFILLYVSWIFQIQRKASEIEDTAMLDYVKNDANWNKFLQNGDDALRRLRRNPNVTMFPSKQSKYLSWTSYAHTSATYVFKEAESVENLTFFSTYDEKSGYLLTRGAKLLQRYFVKDIHHGRSIVAAFRPTPSLAAKLSVPSVSTSWTRQTIRCFGFLLDTMGACYSQFVAIWRVLHRSRIRAIADGEIDPFIVLAGVHARFGEVFGDPRHRYHEYAKRIFKLFGRANRLEVMNLKFSFEGIRSLFYDNWHFNEPGNFFPFELNPDHSLAHNPVEIDLLGDFNF